MAFIDYDQNEPRANILRISTINPKALRTHLDLYRALVLGPSPLSRTRREKERSDRPCARLMAQRARPYTARRNHWVTMASATFRPSIPCVR